MSVCLEDGFGCYHPDGSTEECVQSAIQYSDAEYEGETIDAIADEQVGAFYVFQHACFQGALNSNL